MLYCLSQINILLLEKDFFPGIDACTDANEVMNCQSRASTVNRSNILSAANLNPSCQDCCQNCINPYQPTTPPGDSQGTEIHSPALAKLVQLNRMGIAESKPAGTNKTVGRRPFSEATGHDVIIVQSPFRLFLVQQVLSQSQTSTMT